MPTTAQTAPAVKPNQPSTKHLLVDARFAGLLAEDFPTIPAATILDALSGEPCKQAISLCVWAARADDPAGALLAWSRKHHKGQHRRCRRTAGTLPERPDRRHGGVQGNRPARGRASTPPSGAAVASGGWVSLDPRVIAAGFDRMGV